MKNFRIPGTVIISLLLLPVFLLGWEYWVKSGAVSDTLVAPPSEISYALWRAIVHGTMWNDIWITVQEILLGFFVGGVVGVVIGSVLGESLFLDRVLRPYVVAFQSVPKIALAPLVFVWIGFGQPAILTMAALTAYFPVLINSLSGLRGHDRDLVAFYRTVGAGRVRILFDVKLPGAAAQIFAGLEVGLIFGLIGDVVMEFLVGSEGLGFLIQQSANTSDLPMNFAAILALALCGITMSFALRALRRRAVFWERHAAAGA